MALDQFQINDMQGAGRMQGSAPPSANLNAGAADLSHPEHHIKFGRDIGPEFLTGSSIESAMQAKNMDSIASNLTATKALGNIVPDNFGERSLGKINAFENVAGGLDCSLKIKPVGITEELKVPEISIADAVNLKGQQGAGR